MRKIKILITSALLVCATVWRANAQYRTADEAAARILGQLPELDVQEMKTIGLSSAQQAKAGGLDTPLDIYMVGLDALKAYDGRQADQAMLIDLQQKMYPVLLKGEAQVSLGVHKTANGWETREISSPELLRLVLKVRASAMAAGKKSANNFSLVRIPALQIVLVAETGADGTIRFRSVNDVKEIGLVANTPISGKSLFERLAPIAQSMKPLVAPQ